MPPSSYGKIQPYDLWLAVRDLIFVCACATVGPGHWLDVGSISTAVMCLASSLTNSEAPLWRAREGSFFIATLGNNVQCWCPGVRIQGRSCRRGTCMRSDGTCNHMLAHVHAQRCAAIFISTKKKKKNWSETRRNYAYIVFHDPFWYVKILI